MDIIVTIPKDQIDHCIKDKFACGEDEPFSEAWWRLPSTPRKTGDYDFLIGFVMDGAIRMVADAYLDDNKVIWSPRHNVFAIEPIPMKGFQGFRYYDLSEVKLLDKHTGKPLEEKNE